MRSLIILAYSKAIENNPNDADAYFFRGIAKEDLGDLIGAKEDYQKAINLNPTFGEMIMTKNDFEDFNLSMYIFIIEMRILHENDYS